MVVCKYFLQNRCRYGTNCKNQHTVPSNGQNAFSKVNVFRPENGRPPIWVQRRLKRSDLDNLLPNRRMKDINDDLKNAKPQWPFTGYSVVENLPSIYEGDVSPEELRWWAYQAKATNNMQAYEQRQKQLMDDVEAKAAAVKRSPAAAFDEMRNKLVGKTNYKSIFDKSTSNSTVTSNQFNKPTQNSPFNSFSNNNNSFNNNQQANDIFGAPTTSAFTSQLNASPFSQNTSSNSFTGSNPVQNNPSSFGSSSFGSATSGPSAFGGISQPNSSFVNSGQGIPNSSFSSFSQVASGFSQSQNVNDPSSIFGPTVASGFGIQNQPQQSAFQNLNTQFSLPNNSQPVFGHTSLTQPVNPNGFTVQPPATFMQQPQGPFVPPNTTFESPFANVTSKISASGFSNDNPANKNIIQTPMFGSSNTIDGKFFYFVSLLVYEYD